MRRVGIEVGGTFTDLVEVTPDGIRVAKVSSTPAAPDQGAMNAIDAASLTLSDVEELVHGSTIATNAVLERKGGRVALFVTHGTRDLLELQRHNRRSIYDLFYKKPVPIVAACQSTRRYLRRRAKRIRIEDSQQKGSSICSFSSSPL